MFHSRDSSLLMALLALKEEVDLFIPVPESDACVMIVLPWSSSQPAHNHTHNTMGCVPSWELLDLPNGMV